MKGLILVANKQKGQMKKQTEVNFGTGLLPSIGRV